MKDIIKFFNDNIEYFKIGFGVLSFVFLFLLKGKLSTLILKGIGKMSFNQHDKAKKRGSLMKSLHKPLSYFIGLVGIFLMVYMIYNNPTVVKAFKILTILIICWALVNYLSDNLFLLFHFGENADDKMNTTAIKFVSNILKIVIIAFAVVMVISEFGYNVNGLLTGIGVGGLAISLAAQEAVSNLISGFVIVFDKPFIVGDLIQTADLQGYVEDVTMRSTKIRTLEDSVVTVPNSKLTGDAIINISKMNKRRINLDICLQYSTTNDLLKKCQSDIEKYLTESDDILNDPIRVNLSKLDDSSINIEVTCYTKTADLDEFLKVLGDVNYKLKEIVETNGASFAFPSTSIYIEKK